MLWDMDKLESNTIIITIVVKFFFSLLNKMKYFRYLISEKMSTPKNWLLHLGEHIYLGIMSFPITTDMTKSRVYFAAERLEKKQKRVECKALLYNTIAL